jgi:hypothetical protein
MILLFGLVYEAVGSIEFGQRKDGQFTPLADAANRLLAVAFTSSPIAGHEEEEDEDVKEEEEVGFLC